MCLPRYAIGSWRTHVNRDVCGASLSLGTFDEPPRHPRGSLAKRNTSNGKPHQQEASQDLLLGFRSALRCFGRVNLGGHHQYVNLRRGTGHADQLILLSLAWPLARLSFCCTLPSRSRRCFNRRGEGVSAK